MSDDDGGQIPREEGKCPTIVGVWRVVLGGSGGRTAVPTAAAAAAAALARASARVALRATINLAPIGRRRLDSDDQSPIAIITSRSVDDSMI